MKGKSLLIDADGDGKISENDINTSSKILDLQESASKFVSQTRMAWFSLIGIVLLTFVLFLPVIDIARVQAIGDFISVFYISLSGIVAAYMGVTAWVYQKK